MKKKYKILYSLSEFMHGSKVRQVCDLINGLNKDIFEMEICAHAVGDEAMGEIEALGVPFYLLRTHPPRDFNLRKLKEFFQSPFIVRKKRYDLVHSLLYQSLFTEPFIYKLFTKAKYVYTKSNNRWENHRFNWHLKSMFTDKIISISRSTDDVLSQHGFKDKIIRIFLGIDIETFRVSGEKRNYLRKQHNISPQTFVFGCAAQFLEWKQQLILIDAFERLCTTYNDLSLFLCGPHHNDDYYRKVIARIADSSMRDKIHILGTLDDMPAFYSAIDCFVLPSRVEPFGYVYIEAMSCNRPVIACRAGGPLDIIEENKNGFLTEIGSPEDLACKMKRYLENKELIEKHGKHSREIVENKFSTDIMVKNHQELYLELLR